MLSSLVRNLTREDKVRDIKAVDRSRGSAAAMMLLGVFLLVMVTWSIAVSGFTPQAEKFVIPAVVFFIIGVLWGRFCGVLERLIALEDTVEKLTGEKLPHRGAMPSYQFNWQMRKADDAASLTAPPKNP